MNMSPHKSSTGLDANLWALLIYVITLIFGWIYGVQWFAWVFPLVILFIEKESEFVRYHARQAMALYVINAIAAAIIAIIAAAVGVAFYASAISNPLAIFGLGGGAIAGVIAVGAIGVIITAIITVFAVLAMVRAYQYEDYKIPIASTLAEKFTNIGNQ